jgi:hypothetical protein
MKVVLDLPVGPVQIAGLQWLIKQYDHGINAILADEVGVTAFATDGATTMASNSPQL